MTFARIRPRLLIVLAFVAAMVLAARVGSIATELDLPAAEDLAGIVTGAGGKAEDAATNIGPDGDPVPNSTSTSTAGEALPAPSASSGAGGGIPKDPSIFTDSEISVLQKLAKRRSKLEEREKDIDLRAGLLKAAEKRVEDKIAELNKLQKIVAALVKQHEESEAKKVKSLVNIYEKMKPKDAARIFGELELTVLLTLLRGMKDSKVAPILAAMDSKKAKQITDELASRRVEIEVPATPEEGS